MDKTEEEITNTCSDSDEFASDGEEYVVEKIVDERPSKFGMGKTDYLIKWEGYHSIHNTWEDSTQVKKGAMEIVLEWEREKKKRAATPTSAFRKRQGKSKKRKTVRFSFTESNDVSHVQNQLGSTSGSENKKRRQEDTLAAAGTMIIGKGLEDELPNSEEDQKHAPTETMMNGEGVKTDELSNFEVGLENRMCFLKGWLIEQHQQQQQQRHTSSNNEAQLQKEVDNLKSMNSALITEMNNLDLFMLHRRNSEEETLLKQKILHLEDRLNMTEFENALLKQNLQENADKMEEMNEQCNDMSDTLQSVSQLFGGILGKTVPYETVQKAIPEVKKKYIDVALKAKKVKTFKKMLMKD